MSLLGKTSAVEAAAVADETEIEIESQIKQMAQYLRKVRRGTPSQSRAPLSLQGRVQNPSRRV